MGGVQVSDTGSTKVKFNLLHLKARLELTTDRAYNWTDIARATGLHQNTLYNMVDNKNRRVDLATLEKLLDFFRAEGLLIEIGDLFVVSLGKETQTL
jgi:DNA-binding Xre family transcriptional regulator